MKTHFWYLKYPLVGGTTGVSPVDMMTAGTGGTPVPPEYVTVATTRPETMLGDTAIAIHPRNPRAAQLVGRMVRLPIVGRLIPIVADEYVVLPDPNSEDEKARYSTGFLKVTPAHDLNDYAIGQRHGLPVINVLAPDGTISDRHGWKDAGADAQFLLGMDRFEAREAIVEWFREEGLLEEVRDYTHEVGHSYRSHVPIEPYLSDQWYVAVKKPIADRGLQIADWQKQHADLLEEKDEVFYFKGTDVPVNSLAGFALMPIVDGRLKFTPDRYATTYRAWLENLRDWPISRQTLVGTPDPGLVAGDAAGSRRCPDRAVTAPAGPDAGGIPRAPGGQGPPARGHGAGQAGRRVSAKSGRAVLLRDQPSGGAGRRRAV